MWLIEKLVTHHTIHDIDVRVEIKRMCRLRWKITKHGRQEKITSGGRKRSNNASKVVVAFHGWWWWRKKGREREKKTKKEEHLSQSLQRVVKEKVIKGVVHAWWGWDSLSSLPLSFTSAIFFFYSALPEIEKLRAIAIMKRRTMMSVYGIKILS